MIFHPITRTLPLRVIREQQAGAGSGKQAKSGKRRSLSTAHAEMLQTINPLLRCGEAGWKACPQVQINPYRLNFLCGRSGSQPANLENVGRRPSLQSAQSDSNIRTGTILTTVHTGAGVSVCVISFCYTSSSRDTPGYTSARPRPRPHLSRVSDW